jgi:ATP synthase I chain
MSRPADSPPAALDPRLRTAIVSVAVVGVGLSIAALCVFGLSVAWSVAIGGAIAALNLWALARIMVPMLPADEAGARPGKRGRHALAAILKMLGLVGGVWLLMRHGVVSPIPMVVGFGSLPIGIVIGSLVSDRSAPGQTQQD